MLSSRVSRWIWPPVFAFCVLAAATIVVAACDVIASELREPESVAFQREVWLARRRGDDTRYRMASDLLESKVLLGLSRQEVVDLLGPPDLETAGRLQFELGGPTGPFDGFANILAVEFRDGVTARAFVYTD